MGAFPTGVTVVTYRATDKSGNVSAPGTITVRRDTKAPAVSAKFRSDPSVLRATLTAKDDRAGVGVISYRVDSGKWTTYRGPVKVRGKGNHRFSHRATDQAGNQSTTWTFQVRVR